MRADEVERRAGALVEHVRVEALRAQQRDTAIKRLALAIEIGEPRVGELDLLGQAEPGKQAALALHQMVPEIAHQADAENRSSDEPRAFPDLLGDPHACRESRATHGVKYLFANLPNIYSIP